jgi:hypothetical protein
MAAPCYIMWNGTTTALTAAISGQTTGTAFKTMMQLKPGTPKVRIVEWGYSFETVPTAMVRVELVETGTVGATLTGTGGAAGTPQNYNDVTGPASQAATGTSASGFSGSAINTSEGTVAASRLLAYQEEWGSQFKQQFPLGREPEVNGANFLRIRATTTAAVNMTCYIIWEE